MCNRKAKIIETPPAAPPAAPPMEIKTDNVETGQTTFKKSKGKRRLTIPTATRGTGVNI